MIPFAALALIVGICALLANIFPESDPKHCSRNDERKEPNAHPENESQPTDRQEPEVEVVEPADEDLNLASDSIERSARRMGDNLRALNPKKVHAGIAKKGWIESFFNVGRAVADDANTVKVLASAHAVNKAAADHATELLEKAIEFERLKQDFELLPLEKEIKATRMRAQAAENEAVMAEAEARRETARNPSPSSPPPDSTSEAPPQDDPVAEMMNRIRSDLSKRGPVTRMEVRKRMETEAREKFKGDANALSAYLDAVDRALAEDSRR